MSKLTIKDVEERGLLLYKYIRGSQAYGLNTPTSDTDYGLIYACPPEQLLGMGHDFQEEILEDNNNIAAYSLKKFCHLLSKSNPNILEALFIPQHLILYEHPCITELKKYRNDFLTKKCFGAFGGYAMTQAKNGRNTKRKVYNPVETRLKMTDFIYTFYKQGSSKITNWLEYRGIDQKYVGCCAIPNCHDSYAVYVDWKVMFDAENITKDMLIESVKDTTPYDTIKIVRELKQARESGDEKLVSENEALLKKAQFKNMTNMILNHYLYGEDSDIAAMDISVWYDNLRPHFYRGITKTEEENGHESFEIRLSSIAKDEKPLCHIIYNQDGYSSHLREYHAYQDWKLHRNVDRWAKVVEHKRGYDGKAMCQALRLVRQAIEIAETGTFNLDRHDIDRDYLLDVKNGKFEVDEVLNQLEEDIEHMNNAMKTSTIKEDVDEEWLNNWLVETQIQFVNEWLKDKENAVR